MIHAVGNYRHLGRMGGLTEANESKPSDKAGVGAEPAARAAPLEGMSRALRVVIPPGLYHWHSLNEASREFDQELLGELDARGISLRPPIKLETDGDSIAVANNHPQKTEIEALFAENESLRAKLLELLQSSNSIGRQSADDPGDAPDAGVQAVVGTGDDEAPDGVLRTEIVRVTRGGATVPI